MVTIHDVAKRANVSPMTVSRAINHPHLIRDTTLKRVQEAIRELGYMPNTTARSLVSKKSRLLSIMITNVSNPFYANIVKGAEAKASQTGYQLILNNSDENIEKESRDIDSLIARGIDGVLITPSGDGSLKNLRKLQKYGIPFVLIDRSVEGIRSDLIMGDNHQATRELLYHLIQQGHRRIALINGPAGISNFRERQEGYAEALKLAGLAVDEELIFETPLLDIRTDSIVRRMVSMPENRKPTAILAANNFIGVKAIQSLRKLGIGVPDGMAVVCFDDPEPIPDFNPFLTVAAQPAYSFGFTGMQFLIERVEGTAPAECRKVVMPSEILIRKSSLKTVVAAENRSS
jgi:LacI family transcriptional regulator